MSNFRPIHRAMDFLMPPSVDEWLPQRHLARFVVEVIEGLDLRSMTGSYRGSGEASYPPHLLLGLMLAELGLPDGAIVTMDALHCQKKPSRSPPRPKSR